MDTPLGQTNEKSQHMNKLGKFHTYFIHHENWGFYLKSTFSHIRKPKLKLFQKTCDQNRRADSRNFRKSCIIFEKGKKTLEQGLAGVGMIPDSGGYWLPPVTRILV